MSAAATRRNDVTETAGRTVTCARCGMAFSCGLGGDCWCAAEPYRLPMTKAAVEDCLCRDCLRKAAAAPAEN
jgi:hypothetical protein